MVGGVDIIIAIGTTLKMITDRLELPVIPIIEKRLMIDIMALR